MRTDPKKARPERKETDQSLSVERRKADETLEERRSAIEGKSDAVVEKARHRADDVLDDARERADGVLAAEGTSGGQKKALRFERAQEDAAVQEERGIADEKLAEERLEQKRVLTNLLRLEREQTDDRLLIERSRSDTAVAARDDFLAMVSHDLRTLLTGIVLNADLQIANATKDEAGQRTLRAAQKIQRFSGRMTRLIDDLVDVTSIEASRLAVSPATNDAAALVREAFESFHAAAEAKNVTLTTDEGDAALPGKFDHDRMFQILTNLLSNAVKFTPEGGHITIGAEGSPKVLRFTVTDTGPGIEADKLGLVFDRFWQVTKGDRRGLGLGLFISRCLVEAHGGQIGVTSVIGKGSTFQVTIPREGPPVAEEPEPVAPAAARSDEPPPRSR